MAVTERSTLSTPAQDAGYKVAAFEGLRISPVRRLLVRGAVDIVEDRTRQSPLGQTPKIMKVMTIAQSHACSRANPSVDQAARRRPHSNDGTARVRKNLRTRHVRVWLDGAFCVAGPALCIPRIGEVS